MNATHVETSAASKDRLSTSRAPAGAEAVPAMPHRLLDAHQIVIERIRAAIDRTEATKDWGSNDLLMGDVLRRHELQVWFVSAHLIDEPLRGGDR